MSKERDERFDPSQPTLIVQFSNTKRKYRPLDRDVLILGRAPGCDVGLEAPDVAPVHCLIVKTPDGWRVRDCTGKGGTRLNGQSVHDAMLSDEDVLQVGSFSFVLHLPPTPRLLPDDAHSPSAAALRRVKRSRHNLAQLALRLRRRLAAAAGAAERTERQLAERQDDFDRQAEEVGRLRQDLDSQLDGLRLTAQEVAAKSKALQERQQAAEKELAQRKAEAECARRASEEAHARTLADQKKEYLESVSDISCRLDIRARELTSYASFLRRSRGRLNEHEESLTARWEGWLREQQQAAQSVAQQREQIACEEALLRDQRSEIVRLMGEMRQLRQRPDQTAAPLGEENERLRGALAERDAALATAREEALLRTGEAEELQARMEALEKEKVRVDREGEVSEPDALRRIQVDLETGRRGVDEQIRQMAIRYTELERAARDAEAEISRERGRIAEELRELMRLRGEVGAGIGRSPGAETLVDAPSPFRNVPIGVGESEWGNAQAEAPTALGNTLA